jgi:hypothetical protein
MAWLASLPPGITVSQDRYAEFRQKPNDPDKEQYRDREVIITEHRGVDFATANASLIGYPIIASNAVVNRSFQAIGGGGYTVIQTRDSIAGGWIDVPQPL